MNETKKEQKSMKQNRGIRKISEIRRNRTFLKILIKLMKLQLVWSIKKRGNTQIINVRNERDESVAECKFLCLTHSEVKQTETLSLEQRKARPKQGEWVAHAQKTPNSPIVLGEEFL